MRGDYYDSCILISETEILTDWPAGACQSLSGEILDQIVAMQPHIVIFGTGVRQVFPDPRVFIPLMDARIGYEIMDTAAACRTYNVLLSEDRKVIALLIP